jgi:ion channel-forming bestrophin family protein
VKHYLRGEEGIHYVDLYHLAKFLPAYALPAGLPTPGSPFPDGGATNSDKYDTMTTAVGLPLPATTSSRNKTFEKQMSSPRLLPARNPPKTSIFDLWPFSALVKPLTKRGYAVSGKRAARERAKQGRDTRGEIVNHNIPLEITLYLSSYIAALQKRKVTDVPTTNMLLNALNALVDSLTGLERILTTPIPHVSASDATKHSA